MTDDEDKIEANEYLQVLKDSPSFGGSGPQVGLYFLGRSLRSLTDVAYTSAEVFDPTKAFQESLKPLDKGTLFLLADEPENTGQAGIDTSLPPKKVKLLTDVEIAERDTKAGHERELEVVREKTKGSMWVEVLKYGLPAFITFLVTYFGLKSG